MVPRGRIVKEIRQGAGLTSSAKVFFSVWMTRSTTDTLGVGTRRAMPAGVAAPPSQNTANNTAPRGQNTSSCSRTGVMSYTSHDDMGSMVYLGPKGP